MYKFRWVIFDIHDLVLLQNYFLCFFVITKCVLEVPDDFFWRFANQLSLIIAQVEEDRFWEDEWLPFGV